MRGYCLVEKYSRNTLGQWSSHSCIPRHCQLWSNKVEYSLNGEVNIFLSLRHQIVDAVAGGENLVFVEHQLPEIEIQQQLTDVYQISQIPQGNIRQSTRDRFQDFVRVNIGLLIEDVHFQDQQLQRLWGDFLPLVEHFDELVHIRSGQTILAVSDGSYLEDGRALTGWAFYEPGEEYDGDGRVVVPSSSPFSTLSPPPSISSWLMHICSSSRHTVFHFCWSNTLCPIYH